MTEEEPKPKSVISPGQRERALGFTILYNSISTHLIPRLQACDTEDPCPYELIIEIRQKFSQTSPTEREESIVKLGKVTFLLHVYLSALVQQINTKIIIFCNGKSNFLIWNMVNFA